jgi:hypothetical protein
LAKEMRKEIVKHDLATVQWSTPVKPDRGKFGPLKGLASEEISTEDSISNRVLLLGCKKDAVPTWIRDAFIIRPTQVGQ